MTKTIALGARKAAHVVHSHAGHAEHLGFVAYAAGEVFSLHGLLYVVSVWLLTTGVLAIIAEFRG